MYMPLIVSLYFIDMKVVFWTQCLVNCSFLLVITRSEVLSSYFIAAVLYFFLTRSHLSPNLAITVCVSFTVSVQTSIPKQLTPSPLPLFTPSLTTATLYHNLLKSQITRLQQIQNSLVRAVVKAPKSCHFTPIFWSLHWLKITECIEYKLLSPTKFSQPPNLNICITWSQFLSLIHIWRCRRSYACRSRWSPYH